MSIWGKVFIGLVVLMSIPAIYLSTKLLDYRLKWQTEVTQRQVKLEKSEESLAAARVAVLNLEDQLQEQTHAWGNVWEAPGSQPLGNGRAIQLGVGGSKGLGTKTQSGKSSRVFLFADGAEGSTFVGEFELTQVNQDQALAQLIRPPFPGESQNWPVGKYHVRDNLPPNYMSTVGQLETQIALMTAHLGMQQVQEGKLTGQLRASQETLDMRLSELNGNNNAPAGASQQVLDGLVETLRKLESERNEVQEEVHDLRAQLVKDFDQLDTQLSENRQVVEQYQVEAQRIKPAVAAQ